MAIAVAIFPPKNVLCRGIYPGPRYEIMSCQLMPWSWWRSSRCMLEFFFFGLVSAWHNVQHGQQIFDHFVCCLGTFQHRRRHFRPLTWCANISTGSSIIVDKINKLNYGCICITFFFMDLSYWYNHWPELSSFEDGIFHIIAVEKNISHYWQFYFCLPPILI